MIVRTLVATCLSATLIAAETLIAVDAAADRHPIDPRVYGVNWATAAQLADLRAPLNRWGGNTSTRYNWQLNCDNKGNDWFFESLRGNSDTSGADADAFINATRTGGSQSAITIPMIDWIARVAARSGTTDGRLCSFSVAKYGAQQGTDAAWFPDAGNGVLSGGARVTGNDPRDANLANSVAFQQTWMQHLRATHGAGTPTYWILDNEHALWNSTHRDVCPDAPHAAVISQKMIDYATMITAQEPGGQILGPEEWGWTGYLWSPFDAQWRAANSWRTDSPDRLGQQGGLDYIPYLLQRMRQASTTAGRRLLHVLTVHAYPLNGEYEGGTDSAMQLARNRSTRMLWDPTYNAGSWVNEVVQLIPRLKNWRDLYYPGTQIGITEYSWGADAHINGATTQADCLGILGREGVDLANRWTTPASTTPTYQAMKLWRNYDGAGGAFGDTSVRCSVPDPDTLSAFAGQRTSDGATTVMVINKIASPAAVRITLANVATVSLGTRWQVVDGSGIAHLADVAVSGGAIAMTVPAQSITLIVVPAAVTSDTTPPTVATPTASPNPTTGSSTLGVTASDNIGVTGYTWAITAGSNATLSGATTATPLLVFSAVGTVTVRVTVRDAAGNTANASGTISCTAVATSLSLSPASVTLLPNASQVFIPTIRDQFGAAMTGTITWSLLTGSVGTVAASGTYTAPATDGSATIMAAIAGTTRSAAVTISSSGSGGGGSNGSSAGGTSGGCGLGSMVSLLFSVSLILAFMQRAVPCLGVFHW